MTERTVSIAIAISGQEQLSKVIQQQRQLLKNNKIDLSVNATGLDQAQKALAQSRAQTEAAVKDMRLLGDAVSSKAVPALAQYQNMLGAILTMGKATGQGIGSALKGVSAEFARQKTLAQFWGVGGLQMGVISLKSAFSGFLSGSGQGFTSWLQNSSAHLTAYRTQLVGATAVLVGMAAAAALSSKHSQNYIQSTLDSRLMARKLPDKAGAEAWIQSAQTTDWSAGRDSRMGVFQTVLSKNKAIGQKQAQKATEDIEKFYFANQEMLQKKGIASAEQLASEISAPQLSGDQAAKYEDIFGLGFSQISSTARLGRLSTEAKDINIDKAMQARPDEILTKRLGTATAAIGGSILPALNSVLGLFLKITDAVGAIPGLGAVIGWGAVLGGAATAGLVVVSMIGSLIPGLITVMGLLKNAAVATKLMAAAQWVLNVAMSANPLGIAIIAIAGLVAGLYILEKKFGLVTKAWQAFSGSSIGKGVIGYIENGKKAIGDMLGSLGKAYATGGLKGVLRLALDAMAANSPGLKVLLLIADFIRKLWVNSGALNKLFTTGLALWNKIADFFSWLLEKITGMIQWLRDGLGVTRSEAKAKMDKQASKEGLVWKDAIGDNPAQWYKNGVAAGVGASSDTLNRLKADYDRAPKGFFEALPGADSLRKAIENLTYALQHPVAAATAAASSAGGAIASASQSTMESDIKTVNQQIAAGQPVSSLSTDMGNPSGLLKIGYKALTGKDLWPSADVGGPITGSGGLVGHEGEEISPASVTAGGKTTLERINEIFSGGRVSGGQSINFAPVTTIILDIDQIDSDIDLERALAKAGDEFDRKLLFRLRNGLDSTSLRGLGYLRG